MTKKPTYKELENRINILSAERNRYKKTEAELNRSLRFTQSLLKAIPTSIFFKDAQGRYQGCNPAFSEVMGKSAEDLRGKTVHELWPSEHAEVYHQKDLELMQHPTDQVYEFEVKDKDGIIRPVIFYKSVFRDEHGKVAGLVGGFVDITEQKRMGEALKEAYGIIKESPAAAFLWKNEEGWPVEFVTENVAGLFGYVVDDFISSSISYVDVVHPDDLARVAEEVSDFSKEEGRDRFTHEPYRIITKGGDVKWVSDSTFIRRDEQGQISHYQGIVEDVTERKKIEDELKSNEKFLQDIFDGIQDGISVLDTDLNIIRVNQWMEEMYRSSGPLVGKKCHEVYQGRDDLCPWCPSIHTLKSGKALTEVVPFPSADNPEGWLEISSFPIKNMAGAVTGVIEHVKNITERKKAEEELTRHREHLEELVEERTKELAAAHDELLRSERLSVLGQLTATVSHELRNPLGVIRSSSFYLQRRCKGQDERVKKHINRIEDQVEICDSIVGDLLEYTRGQHSQTVKGEINPWLEQIINEISMSAGAKIEIVLDNELPEVHFDKEKIRRVVVNLMDNALQAIKERRSIENDNESYSPVIEVSSTAKDKGIMITVKDNGIGMDKETMERAFEPLFTNKAQGTGLGLANVKKIVEEHHGAIFLESKPHKGTTVIMTLPAMVK